MGRGGGALPFVRPENLRESRGERGASPLLRAAAVHPGVAQNAFRLHQVAVQDAQHPELPAQQPPVPGQPPRVHRRVPRPVPGHHPHPVAVSRAGPADANLREAARGSQSQKVGEETAAVSARPEPGLQRILRVRLFFDDGLPGNPISRDDPKASGRATRASAVSVSSCDQNLQHIQRKVRQEHHIEPITLRHSIRPAPPAKT